jgi:hypothetical protein
MRKKKRNRTSPKKAKPERKDEGVKQIAVTMKCPRCTNSFTIPMPGGPLACLFCGRPWFWPFVPICEENEQWAADFVEKQETKFRNIGKGSATDKAKARGGLLLDNIQVTPA